MHHRITILEISKFTHQGDNITLKCEQLKWTIFLHQIGLIHIYRKVYPCFQITECHITEAADP